MELVDVADGSIWVVFKAASRLASEGLATVLDVTILGSEVVDADGDACGEEDGMLGGVEAAWTQVSIIPE